MNKDPLVVVIAKGGFCTTKKEKDVLDTDQIVCKVKDTEDGESVIHGKKRSNYEKVKEV